MHLVTPVLKEREIVIESAVAAEEVTVPIKIFILNFNLNIFSFNFIFMKREGNGRTNRSGEGGMDLRGTGR